MIKALKKLWYYMAVQPDKIKEITINFKFVSSSGYIISTNTQKFTTEKSNFYNTGFDERMKMYSEIRDKYNEKFNEKAKELLIKNRKEKDKEKLYTSLKQGYSIKGKHIISCLWDIDIETEPVSYEEYYATKNTNKLWWNEKHWAS